MILSKQSKVTVILPHIIIGHSLQGQSCMLRHDEGVSIYYLLFIILSILFNLFICIYLVYFFVFLFNYFIYLNFTYSECNASKGLSHN